MSDHTDQLQAKLDKAETKMHELQAKKDEAIDRHNAQLRDAQQEAAAIQKELCDAQAAEALRDRPDGQAIAHALGLEPPQ